MKHLKSIFACTMMAVALFVVGCEKSGDGDSVKEQTMAVTYYTVDGVWQLVEWNGAPLVEDTLFYIALDRKERRFEIWDNLSSMYPTMRSGSFLLSVDQMGRDIISGWYDYELGDWSEEYAIELNHSGDAMVWRAVSSDNVMVFAEIEQLPNFKQ